ncbi:alpha/beta hydrolase, partial [Pseudomonas sp. HMWF011]
MVNLHTVSLTGLLLVGTAPAFAESPAYGPELQGFQYPHPLQH